jgi:hypothetical protein
VRDARSWRGQGSAGPGIAVGGRAPGECRGSWDRRLRRVWRRGCCLLLGGDVLGHEDKMSYIGVRVTSSGYVGEITRVEGGT